jgi:hypothetical protein
MLKIPRARYPARWTVGQASPQTISRQAAETIMFFERANLNREFTPVFANYLQLAKHETCVFCEKAQLRQLPQQRYSVGRSVRLMTHVYLGRRQRRSKDSFDLVDAGKLYVTNKRLAFIGLKTRVNTAFKDLASLDIHTDGLFLHSANTQKALVIEFSKPLLVAMIVKYFQQTRDGITPLKEKEQITARYDERKRELTVRRGIEANRTRTALQPQEQSA